MGEPEDHECHLTSGVLQEIAAGARDLKSILPSVLRHLFAVCARCSAEVEAFVASAGGRVEASGPDLELAFQRAVAGVDGFLRTRRRNRRSALAKVEELIALPAARREAWVEDGPEPSQGLLLAELLLERSLACLPGRPDEALSLARVARSAVCRSGISAISSSLFIRAKALIGNALRAMSRFEDARDALLEARFLLEQTGGADPLLEAELSSFEASLCRDRRQFREALAHLERALELYTREGARKEAVLTLIKLATVHREQGELTAAIELTREVLALLDPAEEPRLLAIARHNLAEFLNEAGEPVAAREALLANFEAQQRWPEPAMQLRCLWLEAKIARNLGELEVAEAGFCAVRDGFLRLGDGIDAALSCLGLAELYLAMGRTDDVKRIASEIGPIFAAEDIHREALAALLLFTEAVEKEELDAKLVTQLATYLEASRRDPALPFRVSG